MANQTTQIIASGSVNSGASVVLNHNLNVAGTKLVPDVVMLDNPDFDCTAATTTTVTVINNGAGAQTCNVRVVWDHSILREYANNATTQLSPAPFVIRGASVTSGSVGSTQTFRYTATGAEGSDWNITLPAARANDAYVVIATLAGVTSIYGLSCPDTLVSDRTTTQFRVVTTVSVTAGDQIDFIVMDRQASI